MRGVEVRVGAPLLAPAERAAALGALSEAESARHDAAGAAEAERFLAGRWLLRSLAAEVLGIRPAEVPLVARCPDCGGPHGRPRIDGTELRVSLAHCADAAVAVVAVGREVGVDVEPWATDAEALARIRGVAGGAGLERWTRVEAVLKADGRGLRVDPRLVAIEETPESLEAGVGGAPQRYRILEPALDPALLISVAVAL